MKKDVNKRSQRNTRDKEKWTNARPSEEGDRIRLNQLWKGEGEEARMTSRVWLGNWMDGCAFPGGTEHENSIHSGKANWAGDKDLRVIQRDGNSKPDFT